MYRDDVSPITHHIKRNIPILILPIELPIDVLDSLEG